MTSSGSAPIADHSSGSGSARPDIGISDVAFIRGEKLDYGTEAREQAINAARAELKLVA